MSQKSLKECIADIKTRAVEVNCPFAEHITHFNAKAQHPDTTDTMIMAKIPSEMAKLTPEQISMFSGHVSDECAPYFEKLLPGDTPQANEG